MSAKVLLVDNDPNHAKNLARTLRGAGAEVGVVDTISEVLEQSGWDIFLLNYDFITAQCKSNLAEHIEVIKRKNQVIVYSAPLSTNRDELIATLGNLGLTNFLARNSEVDSEELLVTVQKLLRKDIFGLDKYFSWGAQQFTIKAHSSEEKAGLLSTAADITSKLGLQTRLTSSFCTVIDELFTNAMYDAPVNKDGSYRFAHYPRTQEVTLNPDEEIEVSLACDGRRFGVSVMDPFGSLKLPKVLEYLSRCFRKGEDQIDKKEGGFGLGLYYTFEALSHFVINIASNQKTEMIGLLDIRGSYKDFVAKGKSFNIFLTS